MANDDTSKNIDDEELGHEVGDKEVVDDEGGNNKGVRYGDKEVDDEGGGNKGVRGGDNTVDDDANDEYIGSEDECSEYYEDLDWTIVLPIHKEMYLQKKVQMHSNLMIVGVSRAFSVSGCRGKLTRVRSPVLEVFSMLL